jgi:hypothetical protein
MLVGIVFAVLLFAVVILAVSFLGADSYELPEKRAGRLGEKIAAGVLGEILNNDDFWLTNVNLCVEGKQTELDNIIVNEKGVFIIEVKNYFGELFGNEDDFEWIKNKVTPAGMTYQQSVKNPIKQVRRQIYILSQLFKSNGIRVWIEGYVFFIEGNSPIESRYILKTQADIDIAIHGGRRNSIDEGTRERIRQLLLGYV